MAANILDASALLHALPGILPPGKKKLESPQDAIAALIHTVFTVLGFRLISTDESGPSRTLENNVLPEEWNQHGPGSYVFRYRHEQSSLEFLVKVVKLGNRTLVNSIAVETDKTASLDVATSDFTSTSFFPHDLSASNPPPLVHGFISSNRINDFVSQLKLTTLQKLMPGLRKEGYSEEADTNAGPSRARAPEGPPPARPRPEQPPYAPEDIYPGAVPRNPLEIGRRDRDPFPGNPFAPPPMFPDTSGDGPGGMGPWGGDGYLPPLGAPPGARFDPIGPGPLPGPPQFPGQGPFPRRGPFGGQEPDNDDFPPPGSLIAIEAAMQSPTRARRQKSELPSFMRRPPKPEGVKNVTKVNIDKLTPRELEERYKRNARTLSETSASSSTFIKQLEDQQAAIRTRLNELGVEGIRNQLEQTSIHDDRQAMNVDAAPGPSSPPPQPDPKPISAKQRALARWAGMGNTAGTAAMSYQEADQILRDSFVREQEHKQKVLDRRRRRGEVLEGEQLSRSEMDARMWAFLTYKPSESDMEDDDEDEEDDEEKEEGRPAWWDEDDQEDGIKGQDIVEPDYEDLSTIIRIDEARIPFSIPRDE
ncbi:hypothetical protein BN946_scf184652.g12 [Trametes cinnabarina]|uniref:PI31 proteasome regulator N-terminal domain-containing protein n=1 Tax=Pycnoporus cinnabarinus TaxID=5643 RepID=A0A060S2Z1_PYCCI|nr:hypothetical protein BN946_scf184652.g12 [Trametes cinnabarina]